MDSTNFTRSRMKDMFGWLEGEKNKAMGTHGKKK
jgi:hypothetical protein